MDNVHLQWFLFLFITKMVPFLLGLNSIPILQQLFSLEEMLLTIKWLNNAYKILKPQSKLLLDQQMFRDGLLIVVILGLTLKYQILELLQQLLVYTANLDSI